MVAKDVKGWLCGSGWLDAKEIWFGGWKSFVAIFFSKGSLRRSLIMGAIERPSVTAREPFFEGKS